MQPSIEKRLIVEKVLYKVSVWSAGYEVELSAGNKEALETLIRNLELDLPYGLDHDQIRREVVASTESPERSELERDVLGVYLSESPSGYSKISAIKRYRELTGLGLKESKDAVDLLVSQSGY